MNLYQDFPKFNYLINRCSHRTYTDSQIQLAYQAIRRLKRKGDWKPPGPPCVTVETLRVIFSDHKYF